MNIKITNYEKENILTALEQRKFKIEEILKNMSGISSLMFIQYSNQLDCINNVIKKIENKQRTK